MSSTSGGFSQSASSDFDPKHGILESGSLNTNGEYMYLTGISNPPSGRMGPLFVKQLDETVSISDIVLFQADLEFNYAFDEYGWLSVYLFDENKKKAIMLRVHDAWQSTSSRQEAVFFNPEEIGDGTVFDESASGSWRANISCWYNTSTDTIEGVIDDGVSIESVIEASGNFNSSRRIQYIGIQWSKDTTNTYNGANLRLHDILFEYNSASSTASSQPYPEINNPPDRVYEAGSINHLIEWEVYNFIATSYEIYRNGGLLSSGIMTGISLSVDLENLFPGLYNFTAVVFGDNLEMVSDTVLITISDTTAPSLGQPTDIIYEYGSTGNSIIWSISDLYPDDYRITRDGVLVQSTNWIVGTIAYDIDGLGLGVYNYTIEADDDNDNFDVDTVMVTVEDTTAPGLTHPSNIVVDIDTPIIEITWQATDLLPESYEIYQNGTLITAGTWQSESNLTYSRTGLTPGNYEITIVVSDTSGNTATDTVFVTIGEQSLGDLGGFMVIGITIGSITVIVIIGGLACKSRGKGIPGVSDFQYG